MDTVLVIEDSRSMQRALKRLFESDGLAVQIESDGLAGLESFRKSVPSVVLLDLNLPKLPGKEVCRALKKHAASVPVVVLSADAEVQQKVLLLELGADDYITKPFSPKELLARVRRAIRRSERPSVTPALTNSNKEAPHDLLFIDDQRIDFTSMEATRNGNRITLTAQEFKLLNFLWRRPDQVVSRETLLKEVWGYENYPSTRTVDNHILRLRQKLEPDPARPRFLLTVHGAGYKFAPGGGSPKE